MRSPVTTTSISSGRGQNCDCNLFPKKFLWAVMLLLPMAFSCKVFFCLAVKFANLRFGKLTPKKLKVKSQKPYKYRGFRTSMCFCQINLSHFTKFVLHFEGFCVLRSCLWLMFYFCCLVVFIVVAVVLQLFCLCLSCCSEVWLCLFQSRSEKNSKMT